MMNSKQRYQLLFGGTELVEGGTGWYLWELGQYVAVLAGTWYLVLFCLIIGTFDHFRTNISLAGSYGALLVGGCGVQAVSHKTPIYLRYCNSN